MEKTKLDQNQYHPTLSDGDDKKMVEICKKWRWNKTHAASVILSENLDKYLE